MLTNISCTQARGIFLGSKFPDLLFLGGTQFFFFFGGYSKYWYFYGVILIKMHILTYLLLIYNQNLAPEIVCDIFIKANNFILGFSFLSGLSDGLVSV
jgi:hypothetical protein